MIVSIRGSLSLSALNSPGSACGRNKDRKKIKQTFENRIPKNAINSILNQTITAEV
jgi:hypothetical protein